MNSAERGCIWISENGNLSEDKTEVEEMALETMFVNIQSYDYKLVNTSIEQESVISEKENCR